MFLAVLASIIALIAIVIFVFVAKDFILMAMAVILAIAAFCFLWKPPKKHKDYSLSDQQQATIRALGGSGTSDLLDLKPNEREKRKREKT